VGFLEKGIIMKQIWRGIRSPPFSTEIPQNRKFLPDYLSNAYQRYANGVQSAG
jgi:hypothetical protein